MYCTYIEPCRATWLRICMESESYIAVRSHGRQCDRNAATRPVYAGKASNISLILGVDPKPASLVPLWLCTLAPNALLAQHCLHDISLQGSVAIT